ncbi:hypothetical protein C8Q77DRAFT_1061482 [Trametes polyzona]|nr:hypothetical protein C8Q77DRAFT_1061482 [Trametes polyzona]
MTPGLAAGLPKVPSLDNTFGALLIGCFVGFIQYGWTANQCYSYFRTYHEDRKVLKGLVSVSLRVLETFHSVLCMHIIYFYLTTNYFNPMALQQSVWCLLGVVTGAVILASQSFFLRRVWKIGRKFRPLVVVAGILLLGEFGGLSLLTASGKRFLTPTLHNSSQAWMNSAGVGMAVLSDTLLTAALTFSLHKSRTGIKRTDSTIDLLIMYAINTGGLANASITNLLSLIFAIVMPHNLIYAGIVIVATKLYANSMMAVLNSRRSLAAQGTIVHTTSHGASMFQRSHAAALSEGHIKSMPAGSSANPMVIDVKVTREMMGAYPAGRVEAFEEKPNVHPDDMV